MGAVFSYGESIFGICRKESELLNGIMTAEVGNGSIKEVFRFRCCGVVNILAIKPSNRPHFQVCF